MKHLGDAAGSRNEAYGQLAEMLFEVNCTEFYVQEFTSWNDALAEVERRTHKDLAKHLQPYALNQEAQEAKPALDATIMEAEVAKTSDKECRPQQPQREDTR